MLLFTSYFGVWVLQLFMFQHEVHKVVMYSFILGLAGPICEGYYSSTGFFAYSEPHAYFVPMWLSGMYVNGALAIIATASYLESLL